MDYEKLHKDTITKLQQMVNSGKITVEVARDICADFVLESEDERIRKIIKTSLKSYFEGKLSEDTNDTDYAMCLTWLKKQGEIVAYYEDRLDRCACDNFNKGYKKALEKHGLGIDH